jgi:CRP-like cAMP-binding protein
MELFHRDEKAESGFVILTGRIALNARGSDIAGAEQFGPGALLGEAALIAETTRPATAIAIEPTTVLELPRTLVHRVLEAHPENASALRRHVAATVAATEFELKNLLD